MTSYISSEPTKEKSSANAEWKRNDLLALLVHDIRNSIQGVASWAILICRQPVSDDDSNKTKLQGLEVITRNCQLQARLVKQLFVLSRKGGGDLASDDSWIVLGPILESAINTMTPQVMANGIELNVELDDSGASIIGDAAQLEEVFTNLLSNAIKFTAGGRIDVRFKCIEGNAQITVSDTGRGIGAEFLPHVFERFRQERVNKAGEDGLGLGLAIVQYLIERHGGNISAFSAGEGKGATFIVCLPLAVKGLSGTQIPPTWTTPV